MKPVTTPGLCFFLSRLPCPETAPAMKCASPALFSTNHVPAGLEISEILHESSHATIQRIVSSSYASPDGFWYDQEETEWVVLLQGRAVMSFENPITGVINPVPLKPGDWIEIPAHARHRVESTSPDEPTVWLAVHWS